MEGRKSIVFHSAWADLAESLPEEAAGKLLHMIIAYAFRGEDVTCDDPILGAVFSMIKKKLDEDGLKYQKKVESASAAREERKKSYSNHSENNLKSECNQNENRSVTDTVTVTVTDTVTDTVTKSPTETKKKVKKEKTPALTEIQMQALVDRSELSIPVQHKLRDWIAYKQARNEPYKEMGFKSLITQVRKYERECGSPAVCDCMDLSMSNEWKGIIWEKIAKSTRAAPGSIDWSVV